MLKADPCAFKSKLNCMELPSAEVKPFVEAALERLKAIQAAQDAAASRYLSYGGVGISFASLMISFLSFRVKKKEAVGKAAEENETGEAGKDDSKTGDKSEPSSPLY